MATAHLGEESKWHGRAFLPCDQPRNIHCLVLGGSRDGPQPHALNLRDGYLCVYRSTAFQAELQCTMLATSPASCLDPRPTPSTCMMGGSPILVSTSEQHPHVYCLYSGGASWRRSCRVQTCGSMQSPTGGTELTFFSMPVCCSNASWT